ncbi:MAG: CAP domain-containing protein [Clostridia bacterium]|nr:CAP domain-containing protein [Clostridia bacterium]
MRRIIPFFLLVFLLSACAAPATSPPPTPYPTAGDPATRPPEYTPAITEPVEAALAHPYTEYDFSKEAADAVLKKINEARDDNGMEKLAYDAALCDIAMQICANALAGEKTDALSLVTKNGLPCKRLWSYEKTNELTAAQMAKLPETSAALFADDFSAFMMMQGNFSHVGLAVTVVDGTQVIGLVTVARK